MHFHRRVRYISLSISAGGDDVQIVNELDVANFFTRLEHFVSHHFHVFALLNLHLVHNSEELQHQVVLPQVVARFEHDFNLLQIRLG